MRTECLERSSKPLIRDSLRIVHIEDDLEHAMLTDLILKRAGFHQPIDHFDCCGKALDNLSRIGHVRHVILLDLNLPGMSGLDMLEWVREKYSAPEIPVFMLTSSDEPEDREKARKAGATKYILKTALGEELIAELDQLIVALNRKRREEESKRQVIFRELMLMGEHAAEMVVLTDVQGRTEWVNQPFTRTCGYTLDEVRGRKPGTFLQGPASDRAAIEMLRHAVRSERSCECRLINYHKNGYPYMVHLSLDPVVINGRAGGFIAIGRNLNEKGLQLNGRAKVIA